MGGSKAHLFLLICVGGGAGGVDCGRTRGRAHVLESIVIFLKLISKAAIRVWRLPKMKTITVCRHYLTGRGPKEKLNNERAEPRARVGEGGQEFEV